MRTASRAVSTLLLRASPSLAETPYRTPKPDGTNRIPKTVAGVQPATLRLVAGARRFIKTLRTATPKVTGATYPPGFFASGNSYERFK